MTSTTFVLKTDNDWSQPIEPLREDNFHVITPRGGPSDVITNGIDQPTVDELDKFTIEELRKQLKNERETRKALELKLSGNDSELAKLRIEIRNLKQTFEDLDVGFNGEDKGDPGINKKLRDVNQLINEMEEKNRQLQQLEKQLKEASLLSWRTMNDKLKQDVELEVWRRKFKAIEEEQGEREALFQEKEKTIELLKNELESKNDSNYKMGLKLLDYKTKMSTVELQLRKFSVKKINKMFPNADVTITLTKNPANGVLSLDVNYQGKHTTRPLKSIELCPENRFNIYYKDGSIDTFESSRSEEIVESLKEISGFAT